jgi:aspartate carbamoyltransferase catalytic subunit
MNTATQAPQDCPDSATERFRYGFLKGNPQLTKNGELKHLLSIEGLPKAIVNQILDTADQFVSVTDREVKKRTRREPAPPSKSPQRVCRRTC